MNHYNNMIKLIDDLYENGVDKQEKLRLLKIILGEAVYLPTLTKTLRNTEKIELQFKQDPMLTSTYYTVAGEFILHYMSDEYEDSLYLLSAKEKQELIQNINAKLGES